MNEKSLPEKSEARQPFVGLLTDLENRETPDWDEIYRGYEQWLDERGETVQ